MTSSLNAGQRISLALTLGGLLLSLAACTSTAPAPVVEKGVPSRSGGPAPVTASVAADGMANTGGAGCRESHTVKKGETLYSIALEAGQDHRDISAWNGISNPNYIQVGQVLCVRKGNDAGVAVARPIGTTSGEQRPLDGSGAAPVARASSPAGAGVKQEPQAGKEAYSEQALAKAQKGDSAPVAAAPVAPPPPSHAEAAKPAPEAPQGPDEVAWGWPAAGKVLAPFNDSSNKGLDLAGKTGDPVLAAGDGKVVYSGSGLRGYGKLVIIKHNNTFLSAYAHNNNILVKEGQSVSKGQKIAEIGNTDTDSTKLHFEIRRLGKPVDPARYLPPR